MKRKTTFDTVGIFQSVKWGGTRGVRLVLQRTFFPVDPDDLYLNPRVNSYPYYQGQVRYGATLFIGTHLRIQVEVGERL